MSLCRHVVCINSVVILLVWLQVEKIEDGEPGKYRVTAKMSDGTKVVDEYNTVSFQCDVIVGYIYYTV